MVRYALAVLVLIGAVSYYFARLPVPEPAPPTTGVTLEEVDLTLFPSADPEARWTFHAARVQHNPARRESTVYGLEEGARYVGEELDLTLYAPEVVIDRHDNLRLPYATVVIPRYEWEIQLGSPELGTPVYIRQNEGFAAPTMRLKGPGIRMVGRNFRSDFALEEMTVEDGCDQAKLEGDFEESEVECDAF